MEELMALADDGSRRHQPDTIPRTRIPLAPTRPDAAHLGEGRSGQTPQRRLAVRVVRSASREQPVFQVSVWETEPGSR
jgi:hypothetical protein